MFGRRCNISFIHTKYLLNMTMRFGGDGSVAQSGVKRDKKKDKE